MSGDEAKTGLRRQDQHLLEAMAQIENEVDAHQRFPKQATEADVTTKLTSERIICPECYQPMAVHLMPAGPQSGRTSCNRGYKKQQVLMCPALTLCIDEALKRLGG